MDNNELQEFDLDDILNEFHEEPDEAATEPEEADISQMELSQDTLARLDALTAAEEADLTEEPAPQLGDTIRMEEVVRAVRAEVAEEDAEEVEEEPAVSEDATIRIDIT